MLSRPVSSSTPDCQTVSLVGAHGRLGQQRAKGLVSSFCSALLALPARALPLAAATGSSPDFQVSQNLLQEQPDDLSSFPLTWVGGVGTEGRGQSVEEGLRKGGGAAQLARGVSRKPEAGTARQAGEGPWRGAMAGGGGARAAGTGGHGKGYSSLPVHSAGSRGNRSGRCSQGSVGKGDAGVAGSLPQGHRS